jgi:hypothetical protein
MTLPSLSYSRADGNTGAARSAPIGIFAIIAASASGTAATPTSLTTKAQALTSFGHGELAEDAAYMLDVGRKPVVGCKVAASAPGTYGAFTTTGAPGVSPSVITAGVTTPLDRFRVVVEFLTAGTIGVTGIKYRESLDGGSTYGAPQALGTATSIVIADTGVTLLLAAGAIAAGEKVSFSTVGPLATLADITTCLDALAATSLAYEAILIGSVEADATIINGVRTLVAGYMASGLSKRVIINVRPYDLESEDAQDYIDDLEIISDAARTGTRVDVCADGGFLPSPIRGISMWRPTSLALAARIAKISLGTDAAYVADGPVDGFSITEDGEAVCWDEATTPGLDDLGFVTLRTFARRAGCFIGNPRVFSPIGSDFVFDQQERCMCVAEERSYDFLTEELSSKKRKDPALGPGGEVYLLEADVAELEQKGTLDLKARLAGEVDDVRLVLSRVDDVGAASGAIVTASVEISSLVYLKGFAVTSRFVRSFNV